MANKESIFKRANKFLREVWQELHKTSWPNSEELKKSTLLVLAAVLIITLWIGGLDALLGTMTSRLLGW